MAELEWLDGYSGQSVGALIALEGRYRTDSIVLAFEQALGQKAARLGDEALTVAELTVMAVGSLEREVNNGGYHQFFVNTMEYAPMIVDALHRIGCPKTAAITQSAIDALELPGLTIAAIEGVVYDDDERRDRVLGECDVRFFAYEENIEERVFAYIKANKDEISF